MKTLLGFSSIHALDAGMPVAQRDLMQMGGKLSDLALSIAGAALIGCATPAPIVRLYPISSEVSWVSGRASVVRLDGGLRVAVAFERQNGENHELRVEIENGTASKIEIDPQEFTFTPCGTIEVASCAATQPIIDPESKLAELAGEESLDQANAANGQAALVGLAMLSAVGDVATIASGKANRTTGLQTAAILDTAGQQAAQQDANAASFEAQRLIWSNVALRRNSVYPGHGVAGDVFVPITLNTSVTWLHVRTSGKVFSFPFRQEITQAIDNAVGAKDRTTRTARASAMR